MENKKTKYQKAKEDKWYKQRKKEIKANENESKEELKKGKSVGVGLCRRTERKKWKLQLKEGKEERDKENGGEKVEKGMWNRKT